MDTDNIEEKEKKQRVIRDRVVHIDLKGAPPKISYLLKMIPLFRQWGATGLLVEYEDMFPFKGRLSELSQRSAYSSEDIKCLQELAKTEGMKFIPLLQSFGHVEFILKKKNYMHLREASINPMSLCPTHKESLSLIEEVVEQYMQEHGDLEYLHIGGDEVFCMGVCKECQLSEQSLNQLYLSHMMPLIKLVKTKYPNLKLFLWDDMFREFSINELEMIRPVIPMVWSYVDNLMGQFSNGMWERFSEVFDEIWIASSFKGSSGPICDIPPIQHHINNHLSWLSLIDSLEEKIKVKLKGIALTGWSRYDHFATLCELLPVAFPSLVFCLQVCKQKCFTKELHQNVSKLLGYLNLIPLTADMNYDITCGNFPGSELILYTAQLEFAKRQLYAAEERFEGWVDSWHVEHAKEVNLGHLDYINSLLTQIIQTYETLKGPLQECLSYHFFDDTVREFVNVKVDAKLKISMNLARKLLEARSVTAFENTISDENL